jgi:hypothetical protein
VPRFQKTHHIEWNVLALTFCVATVTKPAQTLSEEKITEIVDIAINVIEQRFEILRDTAQGVIRQYMEEAGNCCLKTRALAKKLKEGPVTPDKVFLADLIVAATRVWEAFSKNADGKNNFNAARVTALIERLQEAIVLNTGPHGKTGF